MDYIDTFTCSPRMLNDIILLYQTPVNTYRHNIIYKNKMNMFIFLLKGQKKNEPKRKNLL